MSSEKNERPKRKQLLVDRRVQGALMVRATSYWLYCLLTLTLMTLCWRIANTEPQSFNSHLHALKRDFAPAAISSLILLPIVLIDVLRFSNRFTGPMFRVRRMLKQMAQGEPVEPIAFRDGDFWSEFALDFNAVAGRLQKLEAKIEARESEPLEPALTGDGEAL
jgi:hypothetical protein